MESVDHGRDPCPWRILDDIGGAFAMGSIGGGIWHAIKGAKNSPIVQLVSCGFCRVLLMFGT